MGIGLLFVRDSSGRTWARDISGADAAESRGERAVGEEEASKLPAPPGEPHHYLLQ